MYKSRLHQWGLDKKKKEHEMLELVRIGLQRQPGEKEPVFSIRGRQVTLGDALHYFNRKGIKDPTTLLAQHHQQQQQGRAPASSAEPSSPSEHEISTPENAQIPLSLQADPDDDESVLDASQADEDSQFDACVSNPLNVVLTSSPNYANDLMGALMQQLGLAELGELIPFHMLPAQNLALPNPPSSPRETRYTDALVQQTLIYYKDVFAERNVSADNSTWTATSDDNLSDKFYYDMYHGFSFLWNNEHDQAFHSFDQAFSQIEHLLRGHHCAFLMYVYDLLIRYEGNRQEDPLLRLLDHLANMALTVFKSEEHPIRLIALWMKQADTMRPTLAEMTLRRVLQFFQDSIGYFHPETMALLQLFASGLMSRKKYQEAALRYQQLTDAFETMHGKNSYEACYALRSVSEAYFHEGRHKESLQAIEAALNQSKTLPKDEEREIYVRCIRGLAEIFKRLGRMEEGRAAMQHVVDACVENWGEGHVFTARAKMHLKTFEKEGAVEEALPPTIYRLGRGGKAAKSIWTTTRSPVPLQP
jgi:tetratricopeptide (TPR) repeat protein